MWLCKQIRVPTHRHTNLFSATSITLVLNAARPKVRAQKCNLSQLSSFPHIWFPLDALKSHVAASCCVMEWKDCNNKAHDPKPPFAIVHILSDEMTASPSCLWPSEHLSWASHEYMHVFTGESSMCVQSLCVSGEGCQPFCMGGLYQLWQESPIAASGPWQTAAGPVLPPSWKLPPAKQIKRYPLPTLVSWKMTGRDILPSGHSLLTAIN